jgi:hypothetical protein
VVGVFAREVGVFAWAAGLQGLCSGLRSFEFVTLFGVKGELDRVEGIEELDEVLCLLDGIGSRLGACTDTAEFGV